MRPLAWALKEVDPVDLHRQAGIHAQEIWEYVKYYVILGQTWTLRKSIVIFFWQVDAPPPPPPLGQRGLSTMINPALHALLDNTNCIDAGCKCDNFVLATCEVHPVDKRDIKKS